MPDTGAATIRSASQSPASRRMPWHEREPDTFRRLERAVQDEFPGLSFADQDGRLVLAGEFLIAADGRVLDRYDIEVEVPPDGPRTGIPIVREVGGRIPRTTERHMNPDGSACLAVPDEFWYRHPEGMNLDDFLRGPVLSYFIGQSIVARGDAWPYGERAHGAAGIAEFYGSLIGTRDSTRIHAFLVMAAAKKVRARWRCPCGSRRIVHECHATTVHHLRDHLSRRVLLAAADAVRPLTRSAAPRHP